MELHQFHQDLLARHGFILRPNEDEKAKFIEYHKTEVLKDMLINSHIEVLYAPNPDNLAYRGIVTFLREDGRRIDEWDSERRYKLMDVVLGCERITSLVTAVLKHKEAQ